MNHVEEDRRGEIYAQSGQAMAGIIGNFGQTIGAAIKDLAGKREQVKAAEGGWEVLKGQHPDIIGPFDEKFQTASGAQKSGMLVQAIAAVDRNMQNKPAPAPKSFVTPWGGQGVYSEKTGAFSPASELAPPSNEGAAFDAPDGAPAGVVTYNGKPMGTYPVPQRGQNGWVIEEDGTAVYMRNGVVVPPDKLVRMVDQPDVEKEVPLFGHKVKIPQPAKAEPLIPPDVKSGARPNVQVEYMTDPQTGIRVPVERDPETGKWRRVSEGPPESGLLPPLGETGDAPPTRVQSALDAWKAKLR